MGSPAPFPTDPRPSAPEAGRSLSPAMQRLHAQLLKVASAGVPVLVQGESGTGKDRVARWLHHLAAPAEARFLKLSCPALAAGPPAADPFGAGLNWGPGGTLFLDQVAELNPGLQAQLLDWLQEGQAPGGPPRPRLVTATHQDLAAPMAAGDFRRDLFYRLSVVTLRLPPLRERREDVPQLAAEFLGRSNRQFGTQAPYPSERVWRAWADYDWPGNLRELENLIQRYVILGSEEALTAGLAPERARREREFPLDGSLSLREMTRRAERQLERELIGRALELSQGNRKRAAGLLRISYRALLYKIKNAGVPPKRAAVWAAAAGAGAGRQQGGALS